MFGVMGSAAPRCWHHVCVSPRLQPFATPVLTCALAGLLVLAAGTGELWLVAAAVLVVQALIASGPAEPAVRRHRYARFVPVVLGALAATAVTAAPALLAGPDGSLAAADLRLASGVLAGVLVGVVVGLAAALFTQMLRRDDRADLVGCLSDVAAAVVVATLAAGWISAVRTAGDLEIVAIGAAGVAAVALLDAVPGDRWLMTCAAVTVALVAGGVVPLVVDGPGTPVLGVAVGGAAGLLALLGLHVGRLWAAGREQEPDGVGAVAGLAVALAGVAVHVGAQLTSLAW